MAVNLSAIDIINYFGEVFNCLGKRFNTIHPLKCFCQLVFNVYLNFNSQNMTEKLSMDDALIQKLKEILEENLSDENYGVSELAAETGISRSQLHRRLKDSVGKSSSQFIREYRLERALEMLKQNSGTASEIAYQVGFSSPTYFSTAFKNFYGYSPGEVKFQNALAPPKKTFSKKLAGIIPVILLIALIIFNVAYNKDNFDPSEIEKTIVVLPFFNESDDEENLYFCNGIMAGIRNNLAKIPEFSVVSRRSAEEYRNSSTPLETIASELNVNYVVEGHVQRLGDRAIITAELIQAHDNKILWSEQYDKNIAEVFSVQANVIEAITDKLETMLSSGLKAELNVPPTQDKLAYDHYLKAEEYRYKANFDLQEEEKWIELLNKAKLSYELAIEKDSLFAKAFVGLAKTIFERKARYAFEENGLEEVYILTSKALDINPNLSEAYVTRGFYYFEIKAIEKAKKDLESALNLDPDNHAVLNNLWRLYSEEQNYTDALKVFERLKKRVETKADTLRVLAKYRFYYALMDDYETEQYYLDKIAELRPGFSNTQAWLYARTRQWEKAIEHIKKHWIVENQQTNAWLGAYYIEINNKEALKHYDAWYNQVEEQGINSWLSSRSYHRYGYVLIRDGQTEKGLQMVKKQLDLFEQLLKVDHVYDDLWVYYDLIGVYALSGQTDKAFEMMDEFTRLKGWTMWGGMVDMAKIEKQFDTLRDDVRFKQWIRAGEEQLKVVQNQIRPYLSPTPSFFKD